MAVLDIHAFLQPITLAVRHNDSIITPRTTSRPTTSHIPEDSDEEAETTGSDTDNARITSEPPRNGIKRPRKQVQLKPEKKESSRGRNRGDLPPQYNAPSDTRFDSRFLQEVQYLYGLEPDPWSRPTLALVQRARDKVFTEFQDQLTAKSAVFRNVRRKSLYP
jgi:hypothetical protein